MIINTIFFILLAASTLSGLVPLLFGAKRYKAFSIQLKALFIYLIGALIVEIVMPVLPLFELTHLYISVQLSFAIFEFLMISIIFWFEFRKRALKITIIGFVIAYLIGLIITFILTNSAGNVIDVADIMEASFVIMLSIIFFFNVFTDLEIPTLTNYPFFWLNSAFLVYFGVAFFLFLFNNAAKDFDKAIVYFLTAIHHIVNITYNILITIAICKVKKQ
jgi:hypothetical protein